VAQTDQENRRAAFRAKYERIFLIEKRMSEVQPERRDVPVRSDNIRDQEVKEVQRATSEIVPGALLNIGTVVTGCPCEDGADCTDQVWVLASRRETSRGVLLSKIKGHWAVGAVQAWWLRYEKLQASRHSFPSSWKYSEAEDELKLQFPTCETGEEPNKLLHATRETRAREQ
jgi:hypothetical protein